MRSNLKNKVKNQNFKVSKNNKSLHFGNECKFNSHSNSNIKVNQNFSIIQLDYLRNESSANCTGNNEAKIVLLELYNKA